MDKSKVEVQYCEWCGQEFHNLQSECCSVKCMEELQAERDEAQYDPGDY